MKKRWNETQVGTQKYLNIFAFKTLPGNVQFGTPKMLKDLCVPTYSDFSLFKGAIEDCLSQTDTTCFDELNSLLTLKFQSFKKAQIVTASSLTNT
jgi:hypothetical protein